MKDFLVKHAIDNVWCNREQDKQYILAAQRITRYQGGLNYISLLDRRLYLPNKGRRYHVYNVGQVHPDVIGLMAFRPEWQQERWVSFAQAMNEARIFSNIYTTKGVSLPLFKSYYMFTNERDLIFAIELDSNYEVSYSEETIYTRLYHNAYFERLTNVDPEEFLYCDGHDVRDMDHILDLISKSIHYNNRAGHVYTYINGFLRENISLANTKVGDTVEFIYDSTIKRVVTFTVEDLYTFRSELDNQYKYLLHHLSGQNDTIDYQDDIDIHIYHTPRANSKVGLYYHRNQEDSHRMVTHRDYSISVNYFTYLANALSDMFPSENINPMKLKIEVKVRDAGYYRPLIYDNNRIFELYKLKDEDIIDAMVGLDSTVPYWRAEVLEKSAYTEIMRVHDSEVTMDLIQRGYGYNSISKVVGDTPIKTYMQSGIPTIDVPFALSSNSTAYEYDNQGKMIGYYYHEEGTTYRCRNMTARMVEMISGKGTTRPDVRFGTTRVTLPEFDNYRVYRCSIINDVPDQNWEDVTDSPDYTVVDNELIWTEPLSGQFLMVRTDSTFLTQNLQLNLISGTLYFSLAEEVDYGDGYVPQLLPIPLGELDIFLNGKSLIRGLDYIIKFPMVYIINKKYLAQPSGTRVQNIHVRFTGFADSNLNMDEIEDYGFVEHGYLSNNNRFDIRDDKVLRITVDGNLKHRSDLEFSEDHDGIQVVHAMNGHPYQVKDIVVPLKELEGETTYSLREKSQYIDRVISDYLTLKLPQPDRSHPSAIQDLYPLVSPFFSHLINDMKSGQFNEAYVAREMSDNDVIEVCRGYEYLLEFDPLNEDNQIDEKFTIIHPHNLYRTIPLSIYKYRFLLKVVELYGKGRVSVSHFVELEQ